MLFSTPSHFLVLALVALGFWLIGLASGSGGRRWRRLYDREAEDFSAYRVDTEERIRAASRRIGELERDNAALDHGRTEPRASIADREEQQRSDAAVSLPVGPVAPVRAAAERVDAAFQPSRVELESDAEVPRDDEDDLTQIQGIDPVLRTRLSALGVTRFSDIELLSAEDEMALEQRLQMPVGLIARTRWRHQAALLGAGDAAEHRRRFGTTTNA